MEINIYQHQTITIDNATPLTIWVGSKEDAIRQYESMVKVSGNERKFREIFKYCPNTPKLSAIIAAQKPEISTPQEDTEENHSDKPHKTYIPNHCTKAEAGFDIEHIKIGERYDGYVKLSYNYGMFVTVK